MKDDREKEELLKHQYFACVKVLEAFINPQTVLNDIACEKVKLNAI